LPSSGQIGLVGVTLVVGGDAGVGGDAPPWAYAMPFVGMVGLVAATMVERKASQEADLETPLDAALAIQCSVSALLFAGMALF
jgi:drug/metabolite transporter (DMT)-like permease